ncbi:hypothetical protein A2973_04440 [Candidatus Gottesmanbacteria bacterium RIFCSPLOWO2_01_FULL_49_10]|uniref:Pyrroloquinoline quinone-dependent pyranose dehydrogenase beta-propeller domain-containing protein n=1 Tax=Candidatus Gottesmanbacteria bacterium RIFCSPLOWO2_01_FULL_49_10 TaxID=1798396 RepID=A0A1F6AVY8_9BACT|nr:MAG: hypothetical protein A2973_04440 [Candidatus Gottesmanbacteria bacterium RIFCSPLOWO2_01_FULL_49_10]
MPDGFSISIFAKDLGDPRVLVFDPAGTLLVSIPSRGQVVAMPDENHDGVADRTDVVVNYLNQPHGLAFHPKEKTLFVAETDRVVVYDYDPVTHKASNKKKIIDLPGGGNHFSRTIAFGPDGRLYIAVGSDCNVCVQTDERRAAILVADVTALSAVTPKVYASGLRNSVFFTWHPVTRELWATEMGRDLIGDDIPPDEVNIVKEGSFYGWPYCYGKNVRDATVPFKEPGAPSGRQTISWVGCDAAVSSHIDIPAHSAPLGLAFIPPSWPAQYRDDLLVAYHGSWNRSEPTGYKVVRMKLDAKGNYEATEDFITGWLTKDGALGRPVDLLFDVSGSLYISDDKFGVIYRVTAS